MNSPVTKISHVISALFSPLLIPTYGLVLAMHFSELMVIPMRIKLTSLAIVFTLTGLLPFMLISGLKAVGMVKSTDLTDRRERTVPYCTTMVLYAATVIYFYIAGAPWWLTAFMVGGVAALAIAMLVNHSWKISAHASGLGALTAMALLMAVRSPFPERMLPALSAVILAAGITCTSRLILRRHTPAQIYAGFANGFLSVGILTLI